MKTVLTLVLAGLLAVFHFGSGDPERVSLLPAGLMTPVGGLMSRAMKTVDSAPIVRPAKATSELGKVGPIAMPDNPALEPLDEPAEVIRVGRRVYIPRDCRTLDGRYDVLVHFHGAPESVRPAFEKSGLRAVLVMVNLGIGSGPYERGYAQDGSLRLLLQRVDAIVDKHCPGVGNNRDRVTGRVALSSWSAGYGAIYRILGNQQDAELVDAVLLSDGLHSGFVDKFKRELSSRQMAAFDRFAQQAVRGEKLFAITHTAIKTPKYASTTETANYLIDTHKLARWTGDEPGPRDSMRLTSRASRGTFHVAAYAGGDTDAHCDHLYAIGDTLYSRLADRWSR